MLRLNEGKRYLFINLAGNLVVALQLSGFNGGISLAKQADKMSIKKLLLNPVKIKIRLFISATLFINSPVDTAAFRLAAPLTMERKRLRAVRSVTPL